MNVVRELREKMGLQQKDLALKIGVSQPTISEWEHGKKDPSGERLIKLAELFGVTTLEILGIPIDPAQKNAPRTPPTDEEIQFALFEGVEGITKEDFDDVKNYAKFVAARRKGLIN
ncbi:MAG: helix-turn-helix transcriptional regulator [Clostridia bacterium]|nr:helix-turn-helix transcriptional regulator [Clostridia bacterium]